VVEDNADFRRQLVKLLNSSAEFTCEKDFGACEPMLAELGVSEPPELILMDIGLPAMSGIEGVAHVRAAAPATRSVMLTVFEDNDRVLEAIAAGAAGYLHKSSSLEEIVDSLRTILAGGAPINPHIARKVLEMFAKMSAPAADYGLTRREKELLQLLVEDLTQAEIAEKLFVSPHTVNMHLRNIYGKLQVQSRTGAVAKILKERLV
jgi:DNA-binding NarL/FixJ family response regulator